MARKPSVRKEIRKEKTSLFWLAALALTLLLPSQTLADIYKYVDEEGVIHFTNVPTDGKFKLFYREKPVHFQSELGLQLEKYDHLIFKASEKYNVEYNLIKAVIKAESNFNPQAVSRAGARGLMQLMPKTAYAYQVQDSFEPESNIEAGVRYLRYLLNLFQGNLHLALAGYNAGENAVIKNKGIPPYPETRTYVQRVLRFYQEYGKETKTSIPATHSTN
ncbi:MAG: lytic transglycosylase domain-containing protein [Deltaproteobacteria bacterium]|jgi:soluble lytic murein transglycosylase-like protein|nr:lytic transglycosylase domain-containing protein [Deltaproteobacteria bacterium]